MTSLESAYQLAGEVYEARRARGETTGAAFAYASRILRSNLGANTRDTLVPSEAIALATSVATAHGTTLARLRTTERDREMVAVRDEAAWRLREAGYSLYLIGRVLRRDHSSCLVAVRRFEARLASEELLRARVSAAVASKEAA